MTDLEKLEKANPRGRVDVALFRMGDALGRRKFRQVWPEIREYWATLIASLFPEPRTRRRRRSAD